MTFDCLPFWNRRTHFITPRAKFLPRPAATCASPSEIHQSIIRLFFICHLYKFCKRQSSKETHTAHFGEDPKLAPIATRETKQIDNLKQGFKTHFHDSFIFITGK
jgi:hypothetical protein